MPKTTQCRTAGCPNSVLPALAGEGVCMDHYLERVFLQMGMAMEMCQRGRPVEPGTFDWLLCQAELAATTLANKDSGASSTHRTRLLEVLLCLSNLNEYVRHHSVALAAREREG
jgi:hypothetical protein